MGVMGEFGLDLVEGPDAFGRVGGLAGDGHQLIDLGVLVAAMVREALAGNG